MVKTAERNCTFSLRPVRKTPWLYFTSAMQGRLSIPCPADCSCGWREGVEGRGREPSHCSILTSTVLNGSVVSIRISLDGWPPHRPSVFCVFCVLLDYAVRKKREKKGEKSELFLPYFPSADQIHNSWTVKVFSLCNLFSITSFLMYFFFWGHQPLEK